LRSTLAAVAATAITAVTAVTVTGCVSMASGGPVQSYPITQGQGAQDQPFVQFQPSPPGAGWSPKEIVEGFLTASASLGDDGQVAREYLTPQTAQTWKRSWSATVYKNGPNVSNAVYPATPGKDSAAKDAKNGAKPTGPTTAIVTVTGKVQADLSGNGTYAVPSAQNVAGAAAPNPTFTLVKVGAEWRIASVWGKLLLTSDSFANDYQLSNLYFFDPTGKYLVPDPVYVPVQVTPGGTPTALMDGLVHDLIKPPHDWLWAGGATSTAFPEGTTTAGHVTLNGGTAFVNLGGSIAKLTGSARDSVLEQVSGQLFKTLSGAGQSGHTAQSIVVEIDGQPWFPRGSQDNPVQRPSKFKPATGGETAEFYYLDNRGNLVRRDGLQGKEDLLGRLGTAYTQLAISPDRKYIAALNGSSLYTGVVGGKLGKRPGGSYLSISWDRDDQLWATTSDQIMTVPGASPVSQPPMPVLVVNSDGSSDVPGPFAPLQVAPDGVRVAMIAGSGQLRFGAISRPLGALASQGNFAITLSPFSVSAPVSDTFFSGLTWYGPDDVITFAEPGPVVTDFPVNGGTATSIPGDAQMDSISASAGHPLLAAQTDNKIAADFSLTGSWTPVAGGTSPVYPG
jgi:hypothetical protein